MPSFEFFDKETCHRFLSPRAGETKFGEALNLVASFEEMEKSSARYVILGVPEDIGIQANFGKPGADTAWESFLGSFLNIQSNQYNDPDRCLILGKIDCSEVMKKAQSILASEEKPQEKLGSLVNQIDDTLTEVIKRIVEAGKIPIVIGGGHNNSYGNIKGTSLALDRPVNIMNIDAHTDLRTPDYRHSGNGFSFAKKEGFMAHYFMYGIHKNYTPQYIFDLCKADPSIELRLFEEILEASMAQQLNFYDEDTQFLDREYGLEIDCDAIEDFSSSAMTPSGFSMSAIRGFLNTSKRHQIHYLHLAEAAPKGNAQIGKALSYFVSDFIRK